MSIPQAGNVRAPSNIALRQTEFSYATMRIPQEDDISHLQPYFRKLNSQRTNMSPSNGNRLNIYICAIATQPDRHIRETPNRTKRRSRWEIPKFAPDCMGILIFPMRPRKRCILFTIRYDRRVKFLEEAPFVVDLTDSFRLD